MESLYLIKQKFCVLVQSLTPSLIHVFRVLLELVLMLIQR